MQRLSAFERRNTTALAMGASLLMILGPLGCGDDGGGEGDKKPPICADDDCSDAGTDADNDTSVRDASTDGDSSTDDTSMTDAGGELEPVVVEIGNPSPMRPAIGGMDLAPGNIPVFSYSGSQGTRLARCADSTCAEIVESSNPAVPNPRPRPIDAIAAHDGMPVLAYRGSDVEVARCSDIDCSEVVWEGSLPTAFDILGSLQVVVGSDLRPLVAYSNVGNAQVGLTACSDDTCSDGALGTDLADAFSTFLFLASDDLPAVATSSADSSVSFHKCQDAACTSVTSNAVMALSDSPGTVNVHEGPDGFPVVLAFTFTGSAMSLHYTRCADAACNSADDPITMFDGASYGRTGMLVGSASSRDTVIDSLGRPGVIHSSESGQGLFYSFCDDLDCTSMTTGPIAPDVGAIVNTNVITNDAGAIIVIYTADLGDGTFQLGLAAAPVSAQ